MRWMRNAYKILVGKPEGKIHSEDLSVDGRIILKWILREIEWEFVDRIHLTQDRDQRRVLVNTVMKLRVP
jgi:hypothetical protein